MRKYVIGFEMLNKDTSYTGEVLYKHLDNVLTEYNIKDRIISITRDNASPINSLVKKFKVSLEYDETEDEFSGDLRCFGYVLNLATNAFLSAVHFKTSKSKSFLAKLNSTKKKNPHLKDTLDRVETMPKIVNTIIHCARQNVLVNTFKQLVKHRNEKKLDKRLPENLLQCNETRWLSVHRMLERFLLFRPEIMKLLAWVKTKSKTVRRNLSLKTYDISREQWEYLSEIYKVLDIFLEPTVKLQGDTYETCNLVIPHTVKILKRLDRFMEGKVAKNNPLIALGLRRAKEKILQYYPIRDRNIEPIKDLYLATMLDPHMKLNTLKMIGIKQSALDAAEDYFKQVYHRYKKELNEGGNYSKEVPKKKEI